MSDGEMVRRALAGDAAAYGQLARRWAARVLAVCHARTRDRHAAEDLAQEALLRGMRSLPALTDPEKFGAWVVGIAVRTCLDWLKSPKRAEVSFDALAGSASRASEFVEDDAERQAAGARREQAERLTREVERLPQPYREVLMLYYYQPDGCTYRELAELLGVSAATINARLTKARQMLRSRMMSECESSGDSEVDAT